MYRKNNFHLFFYRMWFYVAFVNPETVGGDETGCISFSLWYLHGNGFVPVCGVQLVSQSYLSYYLTFCCFFLTLSFILISLYRETLCLWELLGSLRSEVLETSLFLGPALHKGSSHLSLAALPSPALCGIRYPFLPAASTGISLLWYTCINPALLSVQMPVLYVYQQLKA